jgi:DMSO/TMAO reductase YedYZ molybdopterin-dependent catalytic subunit
MDERALEIAEAGLAARFADRLRATPARGDPRPMGSGPLNRHGMPRLPPHQQKRTGWPVLDLGIVPRIPPEEFRLAVEGAAERPISLSLADLLDLPQASLEVDFHCVTGWSRLDLRLMGVRFRTVAALAGPSADATHVLLHGHDGYATNLPLEEALKEDVLLVHTAQGAPLAVEHGGPLRLLAPELWGYKSAKWLSRVEVLTRNVKGYWERNGYSDGAHPWRNDREARGG